MRTVNLWKTIQHILVRYQLSSLFGDLPIMLAKF